jgi:hypothetical protein
LPLEGEYRGYGCDCTDCLRNYGPPPKGFKLSKVPRDPLAMNTGYGKKGAGDSKQIGLKELKAKWSPPIKGRTHGSHS